MSYGRMVKEEQRLRGEIARYFEESEAADREEESKHHDKLPEELRTAAKRALEEEAKQRARYEQGERRKKAKEEGRPFHPTKNPDDTSPKDKAQRNFTDPESRIMKNLDPAFIQAYNAQVAVDVDSQIIVAADLSNQAADGPHLLPLVRDVVRNCDLSRHRGRTPQRPSGCGTVWINPTGGSGTGSGSVRWSRCTGRSNRVAGYARFSFAGWRR
jgi:hypothetical protein